jgi:hypothetical protein
MKLRLPAATGLNFGLLFLLTLFWLWMMDVLQGGLSNNEIVQFEFASTVAQAQLFKLGLNFTAKTSFFKLHLALDMFFLVTYSLFANVGCRYVAAFSKWPGMGALLAKSALLAGACDAIENLGLAWSIYVSPNVVSVGFTLLMASIKMICLAACVLYVLFHLLSRYWPVPVKNP